MPDAPPAPVEVSEESQPAAVDVKTKPAVAAPATVSTGFVARLLGGLKNCLLVMRPPQPC